MVPKSGLTERNDGDKVGDKDSSVGDLVAAASSDKVECPSDGYEDK